jgi:hypothetical protein
MLKNSIFILTALLLSSCAVKYSMSGASISPDLKTISVQYIQNRASNVDASLSNKVTEALRDKMRSQTSLRMITDGGDVNFEGEIVEFSSAPSAVGSNVAQQNKFTIGIRIKFTNAADPKMDFDQTFSRFREYSSSMTIDAAAQQYSTEMVEQLCDDIFNKAFVNW